MIINSNQGYRFYCIPCGESMCFSGCNEELQEQYRLSWEESIEAAEHWGWRKIDGRWRCPECTGNTQNRDAMYKKFREVMGLGDSNVD